GERWAQSACERLPPVSAYGDPWPATVEPDFLAVDVALSRTEPDGPERSEVREVEALFLDMIGSARRTIYIENQFLTCANLAHALAAALRERPDLEVLIVVPKTHNRWMGERVMLPGRLRFMEILRAAAPSSRVRIVHPQVAEGGQVADIMVHSKVMIIDDCLMRIGSVNISNRSMGTDSECDLTIEAIDLHARRAVAAVRDRLLAEHCGVSVAELS